MIGRAYTLSTVSDVMSCHTCDSFCLSDRGKRFQNVLLMFIIFAEKYGKVFGFGNIDFSRVLH